MFRQKFLREAEAEAAQAKKEESVEDALARLSAEAKYQTAKCAGEAGKKTDTKTRGFFGFFSSGGDTATTSSDEKKEDVLLESLRTEATPANSQPSGLTSSDPYYAQAENDK